MRIALAGGGTGGHVYPLLAVVRALQQERQPELLWLGSERIESQIVPDAGLPFQQIDIRFSWRRPVPANWGYYRRHILPILLGRPFRQARQALERFKPELLLAAGGYVSAPAIWAAQQLGIATALLEINDPPGLVNWWFAPEAWRVYCISEACAAGFQGRCSQAKLRVSGCPAMPPVRSREEVYAAYGIEPQRRLMLVMGGSLGSGAIHRLVADALSCAREQPDPRWNELAVLDVGGERAELLDLFRETADGGSSGPLQCRTVDYLQDSAGALAAADFYVGRSGAATVGELIASGTQSLMIPDPQHADRQQFGNAKLLSERGQGEILPQEQASGALVLDWLKRVWDRPRSEPPQPPAAQLLARDLLSLWEGER